MGAETQIPEAVRFGPFELSVETGELRRDGARIRLSGQPIQVLTILIASPGKLVTREELQSALWQGNSFGDFEKGLNAAVNRLRENLEDSATDPKYIETVPGRGYRFIGDLASGSDSGHGLSRDKRQWAERLALLIGLPLAALVIAFLWWQWPTPAPVVKNYKQITYDGQRKGGSLVTDGRRVYFMAKTPSGYSIAQVSAEGGAAVLIQSSAGSDLKLLDLSSDGSELLVLPSSDEDRDEQLYAISLPDGAPRRIGDLTASDATWSPDGQRIVYVHGGELFTASRIGADVRKLAEVPGQAYHPRISPDGSVIRFGLFPNDPSTPLQLWDISADGTSLHQALPNWNHVPGEGNWTHDGRYFLFESYVKGSEGIWALPRRATLLDPHPKPVLLTPGNSNVTSVVQSPDGKKLFVLVGITRMEVMRFQAEAGKFVSYLPISGTGFNFTRDGKHVIYIRLPGFDLIRSRIDGSEQVKLLQGSSLIWARGPRLSPDEKQIAVAEEAYNIGIYLLPAEGGKPELLLGGSYEAPDWSPDGHFLAVMDTTRSPFSLSIIDVRTRNIKPVPESAGISHPRWSPDGDYLAGVRDSDEAIMLFDFEKQQWRKAAEGRSAYPAWSPDGKYLYFVSTQGTANTQISEQSLYRIDIHSGKQELVTTLRDLRHDTLGHFISWIGFAPDGSVLALRDNTTADIYSLDWISP